jgi:hypothetical protein
VILLDYHTKEEFYPQVKHHSHVGHPAYSKMSNNIIAIAQDTQSLPAIAAAHAIVTLMPDWQHTILPPNSTSLTDHLQTGILLLPEEHLFNYLPRFRLNGYSGAVVVLSFKSFPALRQCYPILNAQHGSHTAWGPPWEISTLLEQITNLYPINPGNFENLQKVLHLRITSCDTDIASLLRHLQDLEQNYSQTTLSRINESFCTLLDQTVTARHKLLTFNDDTTSIAGHFSRLVQAIDQAQTITPEQADRLRIVFKTWQEDVHRTAEGCNPVSSSNQ